ncbi:fungal-specific transcription factor domain-containing protein [Ilyonectria robusta]|uniref:fungal-specific transcription factor domain-containing protein n=1 Tax=Ilyonectria robusta TaxID=1079257 RepID=UPI001E8DF847|nr:fungal-specific transcription factor domain-containing protein [Ilyonectria robusta]KAH8680352.1 fungal-specific transcription factor domain-containing protein [Ilyonectria robusta]
MPMDTHGASPTGVIKRIRQACANCRRRKIKCSGQRPICTHCHQNRRSCVYEPYSMTTVNVSRSDALPPPVTPNPDLLQRLSTIEAALSRLSQGNAELQTQLDRIPPPHVLRSLLDTYFSRVHNRPYSFFHQASFEQRLENEIVPKCLLFAMLALAVRFSDAPYFAGRIHDAAAAYSRQSWLCVIEDHLSVDENLDLSVIQTVALLAIVDYTAGRTSSGWLRLGLAIRLSQDADLQSEPPIFLPATEREERRRSFWSIYLVDRLMSCARSRPATISDHDCTLQLPCDEDAFQTAEWKQMPTLQEMLDWNVDLVNPPSFFSLTIVTSSILSRCARTTHGRSRADNLPPWDPRSDFTATNASLILLESYLKARKDSILDLVCNGPQGDESINEHQIGHLFFAHVLFHLCHCLLNHPFLLRLRLKPIAARAPKSFVLRASHLAQENARQLTTLLAATSKGGISPDSSFYTYCAAIAAGIHCLALGSQQQLDCVDQYDAQLYFDQTMGVMERLASRWLIAKNMLNKLYELNAQLGAYSCLHDSPGLGDVLDMLLEDFLWSLVDYGSLAREVPKIQPGPASFLSNLPSPCTWDTLVT